MEDAPAHALLGFWRRDPGRKGAVGGAVSPTAPSSCALDFDEGPLAQLAEHRTFNPRVRGFEPHGAHPEDDVLGVSARAVSSPGRPRLRRGGRHIREHRAAGRSGCRRRGLQRPSPPRHGLGGRSPRSSWPPLVRRARRGAATPLDLDLDRHREHRPDQHDEAEDHGVLDRRLRRDGADEVGSDLGLRGPSRIAAPSVLRRSR